ncbi:hypothetical protein L0F63_005165 [Massospora cicadina]|nr:hypothetical protein L0F63_005165 [Massospora cicadina]
MANIATTFNSSHMPNESFQITNTVVALPTDSPQTKGAAFTDSTQDQNTASVLSLDNSSLCTSSAKALLLDHLGMEMHMAPVKRRTLLFASLSQNSASIPTFNMDFCMMQPSVVRKLSKIAFKLFNLHCREKLSSPKHQKLEIAFLCTFKLHRYQLHAWFNTIRAILNAESEAHPHTLTKVLVSQVFSTTLDLKKYELLEMADSTL